MPTVEQHTLARLIADNAGQVMVLTGAGISTPSGIPDFRSPGTGLWSRVNPMEVAHIDVWRTDPQRFWSFYRHRLDIPSSFEPNPAHEALAEMGRRGLLLGVATQNIDRLHQKAGSENVVELHGSVATCSCPCGAVYPRDEVEPLFGTDGVPYCPECDANPGPLRGDDGQPVRSPLKPDVVLFGENLPNGAFERAYAWAERCGLMICIGSSLEVRPVADLPRITLHDGKPTAVISRWTSIDPFATVRLTGDIAQELPGVLAALDEL